MLSKKRMFIYGILFLGVSLSFYLFNTIETKPNFPKAYSSNPVDWQAQNIVTTQYDQQGMLASELISPQVIHLAKANIAILTQPQLKLFDPQKQPWNITAKEARVTDGKGEKIELLNGVVMHQERGPNNNEETITTAELTVFPQQQLAETRKPIRLQEKGNDGALTIVNAVGATINKKTGIIRLLANIRGYYEKPTKVRTGKE